ncbi:MAG: N-acetylglucosamine-6-phosphate deacetylase [Oscillospiraceae bacterium]|nr:N-acetylglucosamine-6-phosphate deacetylase [Oscillospiraceae bacterium]
MKIRNGNLFTENGTFAPLDITFDQRITALTPSDGAPVGADEVDASGKYVVPGFLDIHTHGAINEDASDGSAEGLTKMSAYYAKNGVTSWCPTTMTLKEETLLPAMHAIRDFQSIGARRVGIHLEGPFLCYAKRGAQAAENLHKPDVDLFHRLNEASGGLVRLVTVAPEEDKGLRFIRQVSRECTVSVGHTCADYDTAMAAYEAGASHATHLFNGMESLHHRKPNVIGAAFDAGATVELICDGLHIHPSVIRMVHRLYGHKLTLISDSLRCAGMPDGHYMLGGQPIVMKDGKATLDDGTDTLAGSSISVLKAVQNVVRFGLPLEDALISATRTPAQVIRLYDEIGSLSVGKYADILILDQNLNLEAVYIGGVKFEG